MACNAQIYCPSYHVLLCFVGQDDDLGNSTYDFFTGCQTGCHPCVDNPITQLFPKLHGTRWMKAEDHVVTGIMHRLANGMMGELKSIGPGLIRVRRLPTNSRWMRGVSWTNFGMECFNRSICDSYPRPAAGPDGTGQCQHSGPEDAGPAPLHFPVHGLHPDDIFYRGMTWGQPKTSGNPGTTDHHMVCRHVSDTAVASTTLDFSPQSLFSPIFLRTNKCWVNQFVPCAGTRPPRSICDDGAANGSLYIGSASDAANFDFVRVSNTTSLALRPDLPPMERAIIDAKNRVLTHVATQTLPETTTLGTRFDQMDYVGRTTPVISNNAKLDQWARGWNKGALTAAQLPVVHRYVGRLRNSGCAVHVDHIATLADMKMRFFAQRVDENPHSQPVGDDDDDLKKIYPHARIRIEVDLGVRVTLVDPDEPCEYTKSWFPAGHPEGPRAVPITSASNAAPIVIGTGFHQLKTGDKVNMAKVGGLTEINGQQYTITVIDPITFSLDGSDGTAFGVYTSGGEANTLGRRIELELVHTDATNELGTIVREIGGDPTEQVEIIDVIDPDTGVAFPLDQVTKVNWWGFRGVAGGGTASVKPIGTTQTASIPGQCLQLRAWMTAVSVGGWPYEQSGFEFGAVPNARTVYTGAITLDFNT